MKKLFLLSLFVGLSLTALNAQEVKQDNNTKDKSAVVEKPLNGPQIEFAEQVHDYGKVKKGGDGNCEFVFTNTGNEPLILSNVKASCGCTVPTWTKEPIMPGKTGTIKVRYNTNTSPQSFTKTITVSSNSINAPRLTLKIKGTIVE
ncbi:MAG: DUF1573 domain-containing protein [Bacteroidales bacterium]|jgi:hypothetical protein|nr:DUF1573 domain-containing protein [Bacteroidales bacterium]MBR4176292.1 DUF1573 domain-containing protein [Bacteroidales bacterium]MBR4715035.1 DUF1573 domain-containing protein [Bacteroidales bacterium]